MTALGCYQPLADFTSRKFFRQNWEKEKE